MMLVIVEIGVEREGKGGEVCDWIEVIVELFLAVERSYDKDLDKR